MFDYEAGIARWTAFIPQETLGLDQPGPSTLM
jgi:hypothetical protein